MKYSKKLLRKLLIQSLESRYAMDAAGFEAEAVECDLFTTESTTEEVSFFAFSADAAEVSMMSFGVMTEEAVVDAPVEDVELATAYSVWTLDGEEVVEYDTIDKSKPTENVLVDETAVSVVSEENAGIDKSFYRTLTVSIGSHDETEVFEGTSATEAVPEVVICFLDDATGKLMEIPTVDESLNDSDIAIRTLSEEETDGNIYEMMMTISIESEVVETEITTYDVSEIDEELMVQRTDVPMEVTTTSLPTWDDCDLNQDGKVSALDAILMFNFFNTYFQSFFSSGVAVAESTDFQIEQMDINGDDRFSPIDVLVVINDLNESASGDSLLNVSLTELDNGLLNPPSEENATAARIADAWLTLGVTTSVTSHLKDASWELSVDQSGTVTASDGETQIDADVSKDGVVSIHGVATEWIVTLIDNAPSFTLASDVEETNDQYAVDLIDTALLELY